VSKKAEFERTEWNRRAPMKAPRNWAKRKEKPRRIGVPRERIEPIVMAGRNGDIN
jgi:hypothetical protein